MQGEQLLKQHLAKTIDLTEEQFSYVLQHFKQASFKKGQKLIVPGDDVEQEYFVLAGCLKSYYINESLKLFILQFAMPTWWSSDYEALYNHTKATVYVDCITDTQALVLSSSDREKLCREIHQVEHFFRWRTNRGFVSAHKRLISIMNDDPKRRYDDLMKLYPQLYNIVPKHLIAAYLGISRETLSRLGRV
jgi:CRP-like cAMP-binding protein